MVAGCVILTRQLTGTRTAALAGIVAIVLPRTTSMATEARSYALGAAAAVWLTVLLVRLLRVRASRRARFAYSVAAAASLYLFLYLGLLLLVHAAYVALVHRERMRRWLAATAWALLFALPIIAVGLLQRDQISFLSRRHYATAANVLVRQWFGSAPVAVIGWAMVIAAVAWGALAVTGRRRGDPQRLALTLLAGLWLVGPTALLLAVNAVGMPAYNVRYLTFSTPAAVVLIALGITAAAELVHREWRRGLTVGILLALVAAAAPVYVSQRLPYSKDGGSDLRDVAAYIDTHAEAGSLIVFDQTTKPSRDPRLALNLYPDDFHAVQDIALVRPAAARAGLWDEVMPNRDALAQTAHGADIWAVELSVGSKTPDDITVLESIGYTVVTADLLHRTTVYHLAKG
jgi:mannosyltransferase